MDEEQREAPTVGEGHATKVSVSMAEGTIEAVKEQVGKREFSRFVAEAVEERLRRQNLRDIIAEHERMHGEISKEEMEHIEARWHAAWRKAEWPEEKSA